MKLEGIREPLLAWFHENARILPWRENPEPYRVWVSEIMLQQTRVEAVKPFYERFMEALPDVFALADCPQDQLMKLWEGLGYYNRARNLQRAARILAEEYGGIFPADYQAILALPGIGPYTAGAVASIACKIPVPAVDGNVLRVISRVTADGEDVRKNSVKRRVEQEIQAILPDDRPGDLNQALMELGAVICVPNGTPKCAECPLAGQCQGHLRGIARQFPVKAAKKPRKIQERTVFVLSDGSRAAIHKRPEKGLLAGLYELPNLTGRLDTGEALKTVEGWGLRVLSIQPLPEAKHIFSHVEWHMTGYAVLIAGWKEAAKEEFLFVEPWRTEQEYPIPAAFAAYMEYLNVRLGQEKYRTDPEHETEEPLYT